MRPRKVNIIGHLHPDTDSICAAISYAYLKNELCEGTFEARRAGTINRETAFVLKHFNLEEPKLITSVRPQIKDVEYRKQKGIDGSMSLFAAWDKMHAEEQDTLCITTAEGKLVGLVTVKDIANANLAIFDSSMLSSAHTSLKNIEETLSGELCLGDAKTKVTQGKVVVGTTRDVMQETIRKHDIVLVDNKARSQMDALEAEAGLLILCSGARPTHEVLHSAEKHGCAIISTPYDTYATARLICMSVPISSIMLPAENIVAFSVNAQVEEVRKTMSESRHRFFPILDDSGKYVGVITGSSLFDISRKHVILVDHNEMSQAVDGLSHAIIDEIIDHHRLGNIETPNPVLFRLQPVGCTCTIIKEIFDEHNILPPPNIAGAMLSAILSDTLAFRSPTCTDRDRAAAQALAGICGENIDEYADKMFEAGADLEGRTADEVFHGDFKIFSRGNVRFGVGQGSFMTEASRKAAEELIEPYLAEAALEKNLPYVFYLFTDVKSSSSDVLFYGHGAAQIIETAFGVKAKNGKAVLPGVVSRKKQVIPSLMVQFERIGKEE